MKKAMFPLILIVLITGVITQVHAIKYYSIKEAVQEFTGQSKIFQRTYSLTDETYADIEQSINWSPPGNVYKFYYSKDDSGNPDRFVIVISEAINKGACFHKFCVGISAEGELLGINVVELNCPYAFAINNRRFLRQFNQCTIKNYHSCSDDINAITGATQSSDLVKEMTRRALALFETLVLKQT